MKDVTFHEIIITKDDQKIVSADSKFYDALGSFAVKPMNELIASEDMEIYENNIKNCDGNWYPSKILSPDTMYYTYMRAADNGKHIRLTVVNAHDLLNAHSSLMKTINTFNAQLNLYEDVFFEYDAAKETVNVYNTAIADFDTGVYSINEFENFLLSRVNEEQKQAVKGFILQMKSGVGRSTTVIDGNLLNDDSSVTQTVLDEAYAFYGADTEGVVGHIQLKRDGGSSKFNVFRYDSLTGMIDKSDIIRIARERIDDRRLEGTTLVIIDLDFFKNINDSFGHQFGDVVIKKIADIISNEVGTSGISGRFGGDEFFVVLYNIQTEEELRAILKGIKSKVSATFPDKGLDKDNPLSVSIGAAVFPKDADNYDDLFMLADHCLYLAKAGGRNRYIFYRQDKHGTIEDVKQKHLISKKINERSISYGETIVRMFDMALHDGEGSLDYFMNEFADTFELQNVLLFAGEPYRFVSSAGSTPIDDKDANEFVIGVLNSKDKDKYFSLGDLVVINELDALPPHAHSIRSFLINREVYSFIMIRFFDKDHRECVLLISAVGRKIVWNRTHFKYYRAFTDLLSLYSIGE